MTTSDYASIFYKIHHNSETKPQNSAFKSNTWQSWGQKVKETKEKNNASMGLFAYLMVIQPFLQNDLEFGNDLVAVLLDAKEGGHVLVVGQHWLGFAVVPGEGEDSHENDSFTLSQSGPGLALLPGHRPAF